MLSGILIGVGIIWVLFGLANARKYARHQRKAGRSRGEIAEGVVIAILLGLPSALVIELFFDDDSKFRH